MMIYAELAHMKSDEDYRKRGETCWSILAMSDIVTISTDKNVLTVHS